MYSLEGHNEKPPFRAVSVFLDEAGFLESFERAVLLYVAEAVDGDVYQNRLIEFRDENAALLEVCLAADLPSRVELGSAGTVRVAPTNLGALSGDFTGSCHSGPSIP